MPELPEVDTIVRDLRPLVVGHRLGRPTMRHHDVLRGITKPRFLAGLDGARIARLDRRAKHAVFTLARHGDAPRRLVVQPGMTGSLLVYDRALTDDERRYAVLRAPLDDGRELVYRDVRRIGRLYLLDEDGYARYDAAIGPEPLDPALDAAAFGRILGGSRQAVKKVLMDQRKLAGVGNIYANEALFAAGIDPSKPASRLAPAAHARLLDELRRILRAAIASQGTTFRDYRTGTGERGNFQLELFVYGREGEPCKVCGTRLGATHDIDARVTVFCHRCQR
jgi:formamidopyrimidine-DNA glycosylase